MIYLQHFSSIFLTSYKQEKKKYKEDIFTVMQNVLLHLGLQKMFPPFRVTKNEIVLSSALDPDSFLSWEI